MKSSSNNSQQLRGQIQHLVQARASLQSNIDISGSLVKITRTLNNLKPLMTKQSQYIKNFLQSNETNDQSSKQSQTRRYISRICDIVIGEVNEIISIAQGYFTIEIKLTWAKIKTQFQKSVHAEREQVDKNNIVEFLFKVMNMKEKVIKQFIRSLIYRKCLLWKDLNIVNEGFVHGEKKKITKSIEDYITNKNYAPTRPLFAIPNFETPGQWSLSKQQFEDSSTPEFLKLLNEELQEVFNTVRNYSGLNVQQRQHQDIRRNQAQAISLRGQIEQAHLNYQTLQKKYREAVSKDQKLDIVQMKEKLKIAQDAIEAKDLELRELKYSYRDYTRDMATHKEKIKQLEADLEKVTQQEMKKLKEVELQQFSLSEQFAKIHKNMSSFGTMFQFQSDGKKELAKDLVNSKQTIEKMAIILGKHKNQIHLLKEQIKRLNTIIIQLGLQLKEQKKS